MAKHGGKRRGAGRKPVLTAEEQWTAWSQCEEIRRPLIAEHHERQVKAYWLKKFDRPSQGLFMSEVQRSWAQMDGWTPKQRKAALRRRGHEGDEFGDNLSRLEAVRTENLRRKGFTAENAPEFAANTHTIKLTNPKGIRWRVINEAARILSIRWGRTVKPNTVRIAWESISAALIRLRSEDVESKSES